MPTEPIIGRTVLRYAQVDSTNTLTRTFAERGDLEGLVVAAQEQTAGRGRLGRKWVVPPNTSLQFSVLLRPPLPPQHVARLMPMASLAVARTLSDTLQLETQLKWPNDVLVADDQRAYKKVCGILTESSMQGDALHYVILGIGLNVNYTMSVFPELLPFATTVQDAVGHPVDQTALEQLCSLNSTCNTGAYAGANRCATNVAQLGMLGRVIRVADQDKILKGLATDVDEDGALILMQGETAIKVFAGQVTILKDNKEAI